MNDMILTDSDARKTSLKDDDDDDEQLPVAPKRVRTSEDFYLFCKFILEYENYEDYKEETDPQAFKSCVTPPIRPGISSERSARLSKSLARASGSRNAISPLSSGSDNEHIAVDLKSNKSQIPLNESGVPISAIISDSADEHTVLYSRSSKSAVSTGRAGEDEASSASAQDWMRKGIHLSDKKSYSLVTCFCKRPYAGRPMIECSKCLTWMHLSCAKIKKSNIPEEFFCTKCKKNMKNKNSGDTEQPQMPVSRHK